MPVIHEHMFVYAADFEKGGMALAEKWNLILEQRKSDQKSQTGKSSSSRRQSFLIGSTIETSAFPPSQMPNKTELITDDVAEKHLRNPDLNQPKSKTANEEEEVKTN